MSNEQELQIVPGDALDRLGLELYRRSPMPREYVGGSDAKILDDAAKRIADLTTQEQERTKQRDEWLARANRDIAERMEHETHLLAENVRVGVVGTWPEGAKTVVLVNQRADKLEAELAALKEGGSGLIATERARQISTEGWTPAHDDEHELGELAAASVCYTNLAQAQIADAVMESDTEVHVDWPWSSDSWKPSDDPIRNLVKAGALIAAQIDVLLRKGRIQQ